MSIVSVYLKVLKFVHWNKIVNLDLNIPVSNLKVHYTSAIRCFIYLRQSIESIIITFILFVIYQ